MCQACLNQYIINPHFLHQDKHGSSQLPLLITAGEPAGIGLDILCKIAQQEHTNSLVCVLTDADALEQRAKQLGLEVLVNRITAVENTDEYIQQPHTINVYNIPCAQKVEAGTLNVHNAQHVLEQLTLASELALQNKVSAIVTAPVQKSVINDAIQQNLINSNSNELTRVLAQNNNYFSGHTEFFQHMANCDDVVMMLANDMLKVALVTTHIPLKDVSDAVNETKLTTVLDILLKDMQTKFGKEQPVIKVCGLNPHAGENGHMGTEEITTINPLLAKYQQTPQGKNISSCLPADTLFNPQNLEQTDCFLAMYHDQGLTVLKALGFGQTVNLTLGLPFIRTSVDHGTALDIAGTGTASETSLLAALTMAIDLSSN